MRKILRAVLISAVIILSFSVFVGCKKDNESKVCEHTGGTAACIEWGKCKMCGKEYIAPAGHSYDNDDDTQCNSCEESYSVGLEFELLDDGTYSVKGIGECTDTDLMIPKKHNGKPVTKISSSAFLECSGLSSVSIPDSVTVIGERAFNGCSDIKYIFIPNSVTTIDEKAFASCKSLSSVIIPDSVKNISRGTFEFCSSLASVTIGSGVKNICSSAFSTCYSLLSITIPESVQSIDSLAFANCMKLVEIYNESTLNITKGSDSIGDIGRYALNIYTKDSGSSKLYTYNNGFTFYVGDSEKHLISYTGNNKELTLPKECEGSDYSIHSYAFYNHRDITSVNIPDGVTGIGDYTFANCEGLKSIEISGTVTSIGSSAFSYCVDLASVKMGKNVTSIGECAFYGCTDLASITIPNGMTEIEHSTFYECESLTSVVIPDGVTSIGGFAFYGCKSLTSVTIPEGVTSIGSNAFGNCKSLTSVTLPSSLTKIYNSAFYPCAGLKSLSFNGTVDEWNNVEKITGSLNGFWGWTHIAKIICSDGTANTH